ncbi:hypothetical protein V6N12_032100 [Hibiscus sabdariffa]|uniref:Uncharacterized protein n=1 Tax=Hibiscus sabdariffa TaxID=183260 RepID=A0ABR2ARR8_9ROSI
MKVNIFRNNEKAHVEGGIGDPGKQRILKFKRVQGHAEVEDLCKMKRDDGFFDVACTGNQLLDVIMHREREWEESKLLGEAKLAGCLTVETINSTDSLNDIDDLAVKIRSSERAVENLSHMGFPPDVEDVHLNIKLNPKDSFVPTKERERLSLRSSEEVQDLGMNSLWEDVESGSRKTKDPCAKAIDEKFNEGFSNVFGDNVSGSLLENYSDGESSRAFFSEMEPIRLNKRGIKGKRYSSLDLQDKKITATKRKKRDKAMRRQKLDKKNPDWSELSGRSLSDSDLLARRDIQIKR